MDWSPPDSSVQEGLPGKNTGVGCYFLLQGIFPTQGWNPHLLHWQSDSWSLRHQVRSSECKIYCRVNFEAPKKSFYPALVINLSIKQSTILKHDCFKQSCFIFLEYLQVRKYFNFLHNYYFLGLTFFLGQNFIFLRCLFSLNNFFSPPGQVFHWECLVGRMLL